MNNAIIDMIKEDKNLPDFFTITINYINGKTEQFKIAEINYVERLVNLKNEVTCQSYDMFRFWTHDNKFYERVKANIIGIDYDENYTKIVEIYNKKNK